MYAIPRYTDVEGREGGERTAVALKEDGISTEGAILLV